LDKYEKDDSTNESSFFIEIISLNTGIISHKNILNYRNFFEIIL